MQVGDPRMAEMEEQEKKERTNVQEKNKQEKNIENLTLSRFIDEKF